MYTYTYIKSLNNATRCSSTISVRAVTLKTYTITYKCAEPVTVVTRSKALTVFARSNPGIVASNPTRDICVCILFIYSVCVALCVGRGLVTG
jgi:hypothetical protein